ncbi:MAG: DegV family EDD domain-containing protein, partial [Anaerolineales bacterium]|nr:DegV family EDD domain-containing protein [Anaerolineales bacterium]
IGGARRLIGSMLAIKPVLHLVDGAIEPLASVRTKKKAVQHMLNVVQEQMGGKKNVHVAVLHAAAANEAATLADALRGQLDVGDMVMGELSPVIGTHVGPGTLGVACYAL